MGRKPNDSEPPRLAYLTLILIALLSCSMVYVFMSVVLNPARSSSLVEVKSIPLLKGAESNLGLEEGEENDECCQGIEHLEFWGAAVKWGADFKVNSSGNCCKACKSMCTGKDGPCLCDTWVFCGNKEACGPKFGECWLKKQKDSLIPEVQEKGNKVMWTSGLIFGKEEGIVGLETEYGTLHIKLLPDHAPHSVAYIIELLELRHCVGCQFYRAENRGKSWDSEGNHLEDASFGPPFAIIQGTLEAEGSMFENIPTEVCSSIKRGSVAWVGSGPEFFISLANHQEWKKAYTVFGDVLPEDMQIAEKIAHLPTKPDVWTNINVSVLEKPVPLFFRRTKRI